MHDNIKNYVDPDALAILIRREGGWAWVEYDEYGQQVVRTNRSLAWVRRLARKYQWVRP